MTTIDTVFILPTNRPINDVLMCLVVAEIVLLSTNSKDFWSMNWRLNGFSDFSVTSLLYIVNNSVRVFRIRVPLQGCLGEPIMVSVEMSLSLFHAMTVHEVFAPWNFKVSFPRTFKS